MAEQASGNPSILVAVESSQLDKLTQTMATVAITSSPNAGYVRARQSALEDLLEQVVVRRVRIEFVDAPVDEVSQPRRDSPRVAVDPVAQAAVMKDPVVRRAMDLFGARIVEISDQPSEER